MQTRKIVLLVAAIAALFAGASRQLLAATLYWDGTGTVWGPPPTWGPSAWSTSSSATTPNPAATPGASDVATFNISTLNTSQTVDLWTNYSVLGLVFDNTASTLIRPFGPGANSLTIGTSGINVNAAAGPVTLSPNVLYVSASQTWTNNSANKVTVNSYVDLSNGSLGGLGRILTLDGSGDFSIAGSINASSKLIKNGAGTLTLNGANDNVGLTLVANAGTVILDKPSVATPGLFTEIHAIGAGLTVAGASVKLAGTGGDQIYQSAIVDIQSGAFDTNGRSEGFRELKLAGNGFGATGAILNSAAGTTSQLTINGPVTFTGDTTLGGAGDLNIFTNGGFTGAGSFNITKVGSGFVSVPSGPYKSVHVKAGTLSIGGNTFAAASGTVTVDAGAGFKTGSMTTARTFIVDGKLEVHLGQTLQLTNGFLTNNGVQTGALAVNNGSIVKGSGSFDVVTVRDGGTFAPGNSPGAATVKTLSFQSVATTGGPTLAIELGGTAPGTDYDQLHVTGALNANGTLNVSLVGGFSPSIGDTFDILDFGTLTGTFSSLQLPTLATGMWNTSQLYTNGILAVVPEPHTTSLCLLALFFAAQFRRGST